MINTTHNPEELKQVFESLPLVDPSTPDLRIISLELLEIIVDNAEKKASLAASVNSLNTANKIVSDVFNRAFPSL
jgi:hypothetical protein